MKKDNKTRILLVLLATAIAACTGKKPEPGQWTITSSSKEPGWANFYWTSDSLGNRFFTKTAMYIPARLEGLPYPFCFQFDLGCDLTIMYGENAKPVQAKHAGVNLEKPVLRFGDLTATTPYCYINEGYGNTISLDTTGITRPIQLGTIGADMFQNKVLLIDYPNERFSICDEVPQAYRTAMATITLDSRGRVLLPMKLHGKDYKVMFDNGSSLFQLLTNAATIGEFSTAQPVDTLQISSWGKLHDVVGRPLKDSFELAGQPMANIMVYADYRKQSGTADYDAITGNALFMNKVIVIDFKHKKFGVKG